jgi:hypothetical protein
MPTELDHYFDQLQTCYRRSYIAFNLATPAVTSQIRGNEKKGEEAIIYSKYHFKNNTVCEGVAHFESCKENKLSVILIGL